MDNVKKSPDSHKKAVSAGLQSLRSVGPNRARLLNNLGINSVEELLYHFPRKYEDRSLLKKICQLRDGENETMFGTVTNVGDIRPRRGMTITKAALYDGEATAYAVWFNQPYIKKQLKTGTKIIVSGKVDLKYGNIQLSVSDFEIIGNEEPVYGAGIVPVYPATEGLPNRTLRSIIKYALDQYMDSVEEFLPPDVLKKYNLLPIGQAIFAMHFPRKLDDVQKARRRLVFEELYVLQTGICMLRGTVFESLGICHKKNGPLTADFMKRLPFKMTQAQERVFQEVSRDMESTKTMNRLIQGDVGSGKTVVAAAALVKTVESGYQGVMMAPTEILAVQHAEGLMELLGPLGVQIALLTGNMGKKEKEGIVQNIREGRIDVVVGTHALIQDEVIFQKLGLAVTDEQHRFGVKQRAKLKEKGQNPDILVMTATPIPRTLALTVYGDLDMSVIDELPPGRSEVKTYWISEAGKQRVYSFIREQVRQGRQVYYVCPLVEESDKIDISAAFELADKLQTDIFQDLKVGLIYGRLKQNEKDNIMKAFKNGNINILVATTVIEVGINVPNATVMVIENADRFGLAQLHQLRGRVGRGTYQSYCILIANPTSAEGKARINIMTRTNDGFLIADEDLKLRGPGEFFGTRQSGMPDLKIADIIRDIKVLKIAREEAEALLLRDPHLVLPENVKLRVKVMAEFRGTENYFTIS
ncbi:ATP-dependent DNA helicase RecG [Phosphitispora sp. TUW77]|uniref:ATP-dependent DNA helicase RecG n=1 Tax=Phosphitispora sp. TUW77 TaxID=3152361 RepID=UPI003AB4CD9F